MWSGRLDTVTPHFASLRLAPSHPHCPVGPFSVTVLLFHLADEPFLYGFGRERDNSHLFVLWSSSTERGWQKSTTSYIQCHLAMWKWLPGYFLGYEKNKKWCALTNPNHYIAEDYGALWDTNMKRLLKLNDISPGTWYWADIGKIMVIALVRSLRQAVPIRTWRDITVLGFFNVAQQG